jgi:hypothetical protein
MSTSPVNEIERNRSEIGGQNHVSIPSENDVRGNGEISGVAASKRHMRVKLCSRCPYTPRDLAGHYDPDGVLHACAKCDGYEASTNHYPREAQRRGSALTASRSAGRAVADGCAGFKRPDNCCDENAAAFFRNPGFPGAEIVQ